MMNLEQRAHSLSRPAGLRGVFQSSSLVVILLFSVMIVCPTVREVQAQSSPTAKEKEEDLSFLKESEQEPVLLVSDPLYSFNKAMYHVNDKLYFWALKPVAQVWKAVTPQMLRTGLKNFFYNLRFPVRFVSCVLQWKPEKAKAEVDRFLVNTIIGVGGLGNPAKKLLPTDPAEEDLGQTLAVWGVGNGFYIVFPLIGPTTFRDALGRGGDIFLDPGFWFGRSVDNLGITLGIWGGEVVNNTSFRIGDYEAIKEAAIDPYAAIRNGYVQNRNKMIEE